jgi:hypothetical protein
MQVDQKIPFTSYDFWAYLSAGFLLLVALDAAAGTQLFARESWTIVQGVVAVSVAYIVGQIIASLSSVVFERGLVGKILGYPRDVLLGQFGAPRWLRKLLPTYYEPLPAETRTAVVERAKKVGIGRLGEALLWPAFVCARETPAVMSRLENFLNLYGFCRNTALVAFIDAAVLYWSYMRPDGPAAHLVWARIAVLVGIGMTFRYLKFLRLYATELFTSYAYGKD